MTLAEVKAEVVKLSREQQIELRDFITSRVNSVREFKIGQKVKFKTREGFYIEGTLQKINRKTVTVESNVDRNGSKTAFPLRWHVTRTLLLHA